MSTSSSSYKVKAYAAQSATSPLGPVEIPRRQPTAKDVQIDILYCGICHSDLHTVRGEWSEMGPVKYPAVPGHEIVGRVRQVGSAVTKFKPGDVVGVGCLVDSDRTCPACRDDLEQLCPNQTMTYGSADQHLGGVTYGGYSQSIVVNEHFVLHVPQSLCGAAQLPGVAPLLCAGITTYSPLRRYGVTAGKRVGVVGLGGLGHMAVKLAKAMGGTVVVFTTSPSKREDAKRLGADEIVLSKDDAQMKSYANSLDVIIDTVSADHNVNAYLGTLRRDATLVLVGASPKPLAIAPFALIFGRRNVAGSLIGGLAETQEMLDFCGRHGITSDVEVIPIERVNEAYERMLRSDVKYRFSIDIHSSLQ